MAIDRRRVVLLVGGVGGAKLALGLNATVPPENLTIIVNTGDDFWHYGLRICPDIDTVLYTLSGRVDPVNGWGLAGDTTTVLDGLRAYGEEPWFRLGDQDIATHLLRTEQLRNGKPLTRIIQDLAKSMDIRANVLPMSDDEVTTIVDTYEHGELAFQDYFVRHRWQPRVRELHYRGADTAKLTPEVKEALVNSDIILIGPSNPWLSISPILAVSELRAAILARSVPRVAITPIVSKRAIKGPAAKLMEELGYEVSARTVAVYYDEVINGFVYDIRDKHEASLIRHGYRWMAFDTMMVNYDQKKTLAHHVLTWIEGWNK